MEGKLFSQDFLLDGIRSTPIYEAMLALVLIDCRQNADVVCATPKIPGKINVGNPGEV